jgi:hypothetical protein
MPGRGWEDIKKRKKRKICTRKKQKKTQKKVHNIKASPIGWGKEVPRDSRPFHQYCNSYHSMSRRNEK